MKKYPEQGMKSNSIDAIFAPFEAISTLSHS